MQYCLISWSTRQFVGDFYCQLCLFVSVSLYIDVSLSLSSIFIVLPNLTQHEICLPSDLPTHRSLSLTPPSLFPDNKFPIHEAHFWLDELFHYIDKVKKINPTRISSALNASTDYSNLNEEWIIDVCIVNNLKRNIK